MKWKKVIVLSTVFAVLFTSLAPAMLAAAAPRGSWNDKNRRQTVRPRLPSQAEKRELPRPGVRPNPSPGRRPVAPRPPGYRPPTNRPAPGHVVIRPGYQRPSRPIPPGWRPPTERPPANWRPAYRPPRNWRPLPPPPGFPPGHYPRRYYPGYVRPSLVRPWPGRSLGELILGALLVGMIIDKISDDAEKVVVKNTTYYYDGENYYKPVQDGLDTVYEVVENPEGDE